MGSDPQDAIALFSLKPRAVVLKGDDINLSLKDPFDSSSADTKAGLKYAFDCGDSSDFGSFSSSNTEACPTTPPVARTRTVRGGIRDRDGGETEYTATTTIYHSVPFDIKPQSCPNPLNVRKKEVLPVTILGEEDLDMTFKANLDKTHSPL
jgi:hypothetical protein